MLCWFQVRRFRGQDSEMKYGLDRSVQRKVATESSGHGNKRRSDVAQTKKVDQAIWPEFVSMFDKSYKLPDLGKVQQETTKGAR